jgi:hypothetical protein
VPAKLMVMGAGTAAAENLIRSLRAASPSFVLFGCNEDRFALRHSSADAKYLVPRPGSRHFLKGLRDLARAGKIDVVIPTADRHVRALSDGRHGLRGKVFLPARAAVDLCRDKYRLAIALRRRSIRAPDTYPVAGLDEVADIFSRLKGHRTLWCRPRTGTCARGGAPVSSPRQARNWMQLWETMQGVPIRSFTLSEYLPGREILCQSLWRRGRLVLVNTFERLSYFGTDNIPSGVTSLSSLAKTVREPDVVDLCRQAIRVMFPGASGAFSIDVKHDGQGRPCITEINAGRLFMAMTAFDRVLKHSMALTYVQLALGEEVQLDEEYDGVEGYYMVRDLDTLPGIFHADDLFDGIKETDNVGRGALPRRAQQTERGNGK